MTGLLQALVTRQAERRPEATALVCGDERLTYGELEAAAARLARVLRAAGCRPGDRVCFLAPKSIAPLVWMLGILKAGAIHVPLDAASPAARTRRIIAACEPSLLLAAGAAEPLLAEMAPGIPVGWLDPEPPKALAPAFGPADVERADTAPLECPRRPEDPAHILFTSGSTGMPKGVVITHANVSAFIEWGVRHFGLNETDRLSGHTPLHFDLSTFDIFGAYAAGAELHLVPPDTALLPHRLAEFIRASRLTQWFSVPSVLNYMAKSDAVAQGDFPELRRVLWCGEVLPTPALIYWMTRLPHARFTNLYGPTETTIASSYYDVPACPQSAAEPIPIGVACDGEELLVMDGELCIGGVGMSPGYWRDPAKTAAAFVPHPVRAGERIYRTGDLARLRADGLVELIGRADTQIKSRGYRIELGEIEAALASIASLRESAVVAIPTDGFEQWLICCAYVPLPGTSLTAAALRAALARLVPAYMLPARWQELPALPRNANGKVDRPRLKEQFALATESCPHPLPSYAN
ncbi:MAG TPA: amino acid adenylation domain-containing protein [Burkholderiales bacterium]|nr:amino acid adenylation domain-containing protein [Burkholderiales bacterium]